MPEKRNKAKSRKKALFTLLFVLLNAAVICCTAYIEFSGKPPQGFDIEFGVKSAVCLICALACPFAVLLADTLKYVVMMRSLKEKVSLKHAFKVSALGRYYDAITPSGAGGQPFQIWYLSANGYSAGASAAMPLVAYMTMQVGFVIPALAIFIFNSSAVGSVPLRITAYIGAASYLLIPAFIVIFAIAPKTARKMLSFFIKLGTALRLVKDPFKTELKVMRALNDYCSSLKKMGKNIMLTVKLILLSVLYQLALWSIPYFVILMFGGSLPYIEVISVCAFIYSVITLIITPGNSGAAEGSFYAVFSELDTANIFWAMLVWRLICYYLFILIGIIIYGVDAIAKKSKRRKTL